MSDKGVASQLACNRRPFLSDSGCQRGSVDIHQFDDLPFCQKINPTPAKIPPEIVETPLQVPVPPACTCININHALSFKYSTNRKFRAAASFKANGDCCEGNYDAKFDLQVPCPIIPAEKSKKFSAKFKLGRNGTAVSAAASYIRLNKDSCTIDPKDVDLNIELPCPIHGVSYPKKIKMAIGYGNGNRSAAQSYINANQNSCTIEAKDINFDLQIPCPVKNITSNKRVKASVKYGTDKEVSQEYLTANTNSCTVSASDINLQLQIHCPIKQSQGGKIKARIAYGDSFNSATASFLAANNNDCTLEPKSPHLQLYIPCPVKNADKKVSIGIKWGQENSKVSKAVIKANSSACTIEPVESEFNLNLPCPISNNKSAVVSAKVRYGTANTDSATLLSLDHSTCTIEGKDKKTLDLKIPCPISDTGNQTITIKALKYGSPQSVTQTILTKSNCSITGSNVSFDLNVPCPVSSAGSKKIAIGIGYSGTTAKGGSATFLTTGSNCTIAGQNASINLSLPCPVNSSNFSFTASYSTGSGEGTASIQSTAVNGCKRRLKLKIKFPKGGDGACSEASVAHRVIEEESYNSHSLRVKYSTWITKCGKIISVTTDQNWTNIFTAVAHTGSC